MKRLLLFGCAALGILPAFAAPHDQNSDRVAINTVYVRMSKAMKALNARGVQNLMTDVSTIDGKTMTVKESMAVMKSVLKQMKKVNEYRNDVKSCVISGKTAKVTEDYYLSAVMVEKGKRHIMISKGTNADILVKTRKGWRIKTITTINDVTTIDGKKKENPPAKSGVKQP